MKYRTKKARKAVAVMEVTATDPHTEEVLFADTGLMRFSRGFDHSALSRRLRRFTASRRPRPPVLARARRGGWR